MTIQLPVVLWAILCFIGMYLIVRFLLLAPLLSVMDARREKIAAANAAREEAARQVKLAQEKAAADRRACEEQARETARKLAQNVRMEGKQSLEAARNERITTVAAHREKTEAAYADEMRRAAAPLEGLAEQFLSRLFAD